MAVSLLNSMVYDGRVTLKSLDGTYPSGAKHITEEGFSWLDDAVSSMLPARCDLRNFIWFVNRQFVKRFDGNGHKQATK